MATTARISAQTTAATYNFTVAAGVTATFACYGLVKNEKVDIEGKDSGGTYAGNEVHIGEPDSTNGYFAKLSPKRTVISVDGPFEGRLSKSVTEASVEVVEYT